jgi:hypothetical protein
VRPLVAALLRLAPQTGVSLFFVPDDYATGREPDVARRLFPTVRVVPAREYVRFALGRHVAAAPERADLVLYLGGDLMHAARVRARLGARGRAYKFSRKRYNAAFERVYAVDEKNVAALVRAGVPREHIELVGNLAIDGALAEAAGAFAAAESGEPPIPSDGVLVLPGTRRHEVANLVPFFLQTALQLRALAPGLNVAFAISPFTPVDELERALATGGHPNVWGARGRVVHVDGGIALQAAGDERLYPVVRDAMRHAPQARLVLTIPGTKCVELAALGVPALVVVPLNVPEVVVINGPLQYVERLPLVGVPLKRAAVVAVDGRFPVTVQPNMDAGEMLIPELRGTLTPGEVARRVAAYAADAPALERAATKLRALYARHAGASERLARSLLEAAPA